MLSDETLINSIQGRCINDLTQDERLYLHNRLQTRSLFSPEQRTLIESWYLILPDSKIPELNLVNLGYNKAYFLTTKLGQKVLPAFLLTDPDNWSFLFPLLFGLTFIRLDSTDFPVVEIL